MTFSLTPFLLAGQLGFVFFLSRRIAVQSHRLDLHHAITLFLLWVAAYGVLTSVLGARGFYIRDDLMPYLPGLWLQVITVAVCILPVLLFHDVRAGLVKLVDDTPLHWLAYFHTLRISALGTAYKTSAGEFPLYFEVLVGIPDLLFGLSALWVGHQLRKDQLSLRIFLIWNIVGALVIVPAAPLLLQMGMPGPLYVFTDLPDARAVFTYPMSIAPMIVVPLFVLFNLGVALQLWVRMRAPSHKRA